MSCTFCWGTLKPIEDPAAKAGLRCVSCGTVETAAQLMARALRKAVRISLETPLEPELKAGPGVEDRGTVEDFLKSLGMGPQI